MLWEWNDTPGRRLGFCQSFDELSDSRFNVLLCHAGAAKSDDFSQGIHGIDARVEDGSFDEQPGIDGAWFDAQILGKLRTVLA